MKKPFVIAIDGLAASGKGTLSKKLAAHFGFSVLDTGKLYRAVANEVINRGIDHNNEKAVTAIVPTIDFATYDFSNLMHGEISEMASKTSVFPSLRQALFEAQRNFPSGRGAVIDGRDIGTVIFPDADLKFYVTATAEIRATRRFNQLQNDGKSVLYADVLKDLLVRDERDSSRTCSPTHAADDAVIIDTSDMQADQVLKLVITLSERKVAEYFA